MYPSQARISALKTLISRIFCLENLDFKDFLLRKPIFQRRRDGEDGGTGRKEGRGEWKNEKVFKKWKIKKSLKDASLASLSLVSFFTSHSLFLFFSFFTSHSLFLSLLLCFFLCIFVYLSFFLFFFLFFPFTLSFFLFLRNSGIVLGLQVQRQQICS